MSLNVLFRSFAKINKSWCSISFLMGAQTDHRYDGNLFFWYCTFCFASVQCAWAQCRIWHTPIGVHPLSSFFFARDVPRIYFSTVFTFKSYELLWKSICRTDSIAYDTAPHETEMEKGEIENISCWQRFAKGECVVCLPPPLFGTRMFFSRHTFHTICHNFSPFKRKT